MRAGIRQLLEKERDIQVVDEVTDGEEALASIEKHQPDVAILDIQMPKASGIEVTQRARVRYPHGYSHPYCIR